MHIYIKQQLIKNKGHEFERKQDGYIGGFGEKKEKGEVSAIVLNIKE